MSIFSNQPRAEPSDKGSGVDTPSLAESSGDLAAPPPPRPHLSAVRELKDILNKTTDVTDDEARAAAPPTVPGYEILGELGRGGMGVVYRARQLGLRREVALKMILSGAYAGAEQRARFHAEAEAAARLQHPNIVQVHEVGAVDGRPYFSMELVSGGTLAQQLTGTPWPAAPAATLIVSLAQAVHAAHAQGVVHRDLKPANILMVSGAIGPIDPIGPISPLTTHQPKITDFGLAKCLDEEGGQTRSGAILGTPSYMAPEQASGQVKAVGPAADVYALGAILYELLTGRPPFRAATSLETLEQVRSQEPLAPSRLQPGLPRDLGIICLKCLHKEPARRYASAQALADDLQRFLAGEPVRARPVGRLERLRKWVRRRPAAAGLVLVSLLALVGLIFGAAWHTARLRREKQEVIHRHQLARAALQRLTFRLEQETPSPSVPRFAAFRQELLNICLDYFRGLPEEDDHPDPVVRFEMVQTWAQRGLIQQLLGRPQEAEQDLLRAHALARQLCQEHPQRRAYQLTLARVCDSLAVACHGHHAARVEPAYREAEALLQPLLAADANDLEVVELLARVYINWGSFVQYAHPGPRMFELCTQAVTVLEPVTQHLSEVPSLGRTLVFAHVGRAYHFQGLQQNAEALREWDRLLELSGGAERDFQRTCRAVVLTRLGDHARAAAEMTELTERAQVTGDTLFNVACVFGLCIKVVRGDEALPTNKRTSLAAQYARAGLAALQRLHAEGYFQEPGKKKNLRGEMTNDLATLAELPEFQELLRKVKP